VATPTHARLQAFVRRHTSLLPVPELPDVRLQQADDVMTMCALTGAELQLADPPLPFWAFPWAGGLGLARYLVDHPAAVAGRRVLDIAAGSGLCAIVALRCGAASALAADVDPFSEAAVALNARANGVRIAFTRRDLLDAPPPAVDVILAGDVCYEETMARRMLAWFRLAALDGVRVLIGDPGRTYLPPGLQRLAGYRVRTSRELEATETKDSTVYTLATPDGGQDRPRDGFALPGRAGS
jgi:predicted nicotinamide N-methyase